MATDENNALVRHAFEHVLNAQNLALLEEIGTSDIVSHTAGAPAVVGLAAVQHDIGSFFTAFPDLHFTLEVVVGEGDTVACRYTARGTHRGELQGIAPTGTAMTTTGIGILRFAGGKWAEGWLEFDALGMLQQIGALPAPQPASA